MKLLQHAKKLHSSTIYSAASALRANRTNRHIITNYTKTYLLKMSFTSQHK